VRLASFLLIMGSAVVWLGAITFQGMEIVRRSAEQIT